MNFSFWRNKDEPSFQVTLNGVTYSSYWAFCACLNRALEAEIPITTPSFVLGADEEQLKRLFIDDNGLYIPLIDERIALLKDAAAKLESKYQGDFFNCLNDASFDALKLLNLIIADFPSFFDASWFKGQPGIFILWI